METFFLQRVVEGVVVEADGNGGLAGTVDNARHHASATQAAARTRTLIGTLLGLDFDGHEKLQRSKKDAGRDQPVSGDATHGAWRRNHSIKR